ncbi:MAG: hypothetical protein P8R42_14190 [Candidatus Binatia bacterium]|nr:hypothetical protein [Candidatus Binatia bacterium]
MVRRFMELRIRPVPDWSLAIDSVTLREEPLPALELFERFPLSQLSHGICPKCLEAMRH